MLGIRIPQDFTNRHRARYLVDCCDLEGEFRFVGIRELSLHWRVDAERVKCNRVIRTRPVVKLVPVAVPVKIGRDVGVGSDEILPAFLLRRDVGECIVQQIFILIFRINIVLAGRPVHTTSIHLHSGLALWTRPEVVDDSRVVVQRLKEPVVEAALDECVVRFAIFL
jgi:hypothetical protein